MEDFQGTLLREKIIVEKRFYHILPIIKGRKEYKNIYKSIYIYLLIYEKKMKEQQRRLSEMNELVYLQGMSENGMQRIRNEDTVEGKLL